VTGLRARQVAATGMAAVRVRRACSRRGLLQEYVCATGLRGHERCNEVHARGECVRDGFVRATCVGATGMRRACVRATGGVQKAAGGNGCGCARDASVDREEYAWA
jgi:hypothetical protein